MLACIILTHLRSDDLLFSHIDFVTDEHHDNFASAGVFELFAPRVERKERVLVGYVVDKEGTDRFSEEYWGEVLEFLLAERVPDVHLRPLVGSLNGHVLLLVLYLL